MEDSENIIFKPIRIEDKELFKKYLIINKFSNSEYNFTTFSAWQFAFQLEYAIIEDCLCVVGHSKDKDYSYFPLGEAKNVKKSLEVLMKIFENKNKTFTMISLSEPMIKILEDVGLKDLFEEEHRRDFDDYVYTRESLITLSGKKLHGKRNHFNFFKNNYNYHLDPITEKNEVACRAMLKTAIVERSLNPEEELNATMMILTYREELDVKGSALYVEDELVGVILGECHHNVAVLHIAKSNIEYRGANVALFKLFLEENLNHCNFVNMMEDMGIEGLRKAKMSFNPEYMIEKIMFKKK